MSSKGNGAVLIEAIVACFRDPSDSSFERISSFALYDWQRAETWLDTSGMSFYFLDRLKTSGSSHVIPCFTLRHLEEKLALNKLRLADMLEEFVAINEAFREACVSYANLKGFTLVPLSCPDVDLRRQADLDFLVDPNQLESARRILESRGYMLSGETARTLEMKIGTRLQIGSDGRCKPKPGRSIELHVSLESVDPMRRSVVRDERLNRLVQWTDNGKQFPALTPADQMICQAVHILSHLRGERTRLSWLWEFRYHVLARRDDTAFWEELRSRSVGQSEAVIALGLSIKLATNLIGTFSHSELDIWTVGALPPKVRLWAEHFGRRAILVGAPGTKLYLLLEDALRDGTGLHSRIDSTHRLIPFHRPQQVLRPQRNESLRLRMHRAVVESRFILYRLRFHLRQGLIHLIDARRWRTVLNQNGQSESFIRESNSFRASEDSGR